MQRRNRKHGHQNECGWRKDTAVWGCQVGGRDRGSGWVTMHFVGLIYACTAAMATPLATHLFNLNWKFKTATRLENYVLALKGVPRTDLYGLQKGQQDSEWEWKWAWDWAWTWTGQWVWDVVNLHSPSWACNGLYFGPDPRPLAKPVCQLFRPGLHWISKRRWPPRDWHQFRRPPWQSHACPSYRRDAGEVGKQEQLQGDKAQGIGFNCMAICIIKEKHWPNLSLIRARWEHFTWRRELLDFPQLNI